MRKKIKWQKPELVFIDRVRRTVGCNCKYGSGNPPESCSSGNKDDVGCVMGHKFH